MRLENKVALITGGYGGMARASARLFSKQGATVFIAGRNEERGKALASEINGEGGKAYFVELDVISWRSLKKAGRGKRLGLCGSGAAAHIIAQVAI